MSQYAADMRTALADNLPMGSWLVQPVITIGSLAIFEGGTFRGVSSHQVTAGSRLVLCDPRDDPSGAVPAGSTFRVVLPAPSKDLIGDAVFVKNITTESANAIVVTPSRRKLGPGERLQRPDDTLPDGTPAELVVKIEGADNDSFAASYGGRIYVWTGSIWVKQP